jgi:hypothetical protein
MTDAVKCTEHEWSPGEVKPGDVANFIQRAKGIRECALELFDQRALKAMATGSGGSINTYVSEAVDAAISGTLGIISHCYPEFIIGTAISVGEDGVKEFTITVADDLVSRYFEEVSS